MGEENTDPKKVESDEHTEEQQEIPSEDKTKWLLEEYAKILDALASEKYVEKVLKEYIDSLGDTKALDDILSTDVKKKIKDNIISNIQKSLEARIISETDATDYGYRVKAASSIFDLQSQAEHEFHKIYAKALGSLAEVKATLVAKADDIEKKYKEIAGEKESKWTKKILGNDWDLETYISKELSRANSVLDNNKDKFDENIGLLLKVTEQHAKDLLDKHFGIKTDLDQDS